MRRNPVNLSFSAGSGTVLGGSPSGCALFKTLVKVAWTGLNKKTKKDDGALWARPKPMTTAVEGE